MAKKSKIISSKAISKLAQIEKKESKKAGHYAFLIGIGLAIVAGLFVHPFDSDWVALIAAILVIFGIVVGFMNIKTKETMGFLVAAIALMAVGGANLTAISWWDIGVTLQDMVWYIRVFVAPAALVVAIKTIKVLAED